MEIWKDIEGFEGRYQISNQGRVKSLVCNNFGRYKKNSGEWILKAGKSHCGYMRVLLVDKNGGRHSLFVHRLVLIAFFGIDSEKKQVNHINGIKDDNRLENLEWVTQSENMKHAYRIGLEKPVVNGLEKRIAAKRNGVIVGEYPAIRVMCRELNVNRRSVVRQLRGKKGYKTSKGLTFELL